jgi:hypothetical protein
MNNIAALFTCFTTKRTLMLSKNLKLFFAGTILLFSACQQGQQVQDSKETSAGQSNFHKVSVTEVLQASEYTYLHAKENSGEVWLAVPSMPAKAGDTYYYEGGIEMKKFESKDLKRTFDAVLLLEKLYTEPKSSAAIASDKPYSSPTPEPAAAAAATNPDEASATSESYKRKAAPLEKKAIKVVAAKDGITIAKLYSGKESMEGKTVTIKGQVTKYTPAVMKKNWIHIQDGSDFKGKFDLTVTSDQEVKIGDVVTLQGKISLNKDLGYGYFFDVIMEDAVVK